VLVLLFILGVVGLMLFALWPSGHGTRVVGVLAPIALALILCLAGDRRRSWAGGLFWIGAAALVSVGAWWFVPTTSGLSLWNAGVEADRHVAELGALAAGDTRGYEAGNPARGELVAQFPEFESRLRAAEDAWVERTVAAALQEAESLLKTEPLRASRQLRELADALAPSDRHAGAREQLREGRWRAVYACLEQLRREARGLIAQERYAQAAEAATRLEEALSGELADLNRDPGLAERLRREVRKAPEGDTTLAQHIQQQEDRSIDGQAPAVQLARLRESYHFLADLARQAGRRE
jgi:hypothetical protein